MILQTLSFLKSASGFLSSTNTSALSLKLFLEGLAGKEWKVLYSNRQTVAESHTASLPSSFEEPCSCQIPGTVTCLLCQSQSDLEAHAHGQRVKSDRLDNCNSNAFASHSSRSDLDQRSFPRQDVIQRWLYGFCKIFNSRFEERGFESWVVVFWPTPLLRKRCRTTHTHYKKDLKSEILLLPFCFKLSSSKNSRNFYSLSTHSDLT